MACAERSPKPVGAPDTELPIAGLGGRSYAFLLDWHIRAVAGLAWYAASVWGLDRDFIPKETDTIFWWAAVAPALAIYFLYHAGFEILTGASPGKRLAGVRIVDRNGRTPGIGALVVRNVLRPIDSLVFYAVGLASVLLTRDAVRIGDLAAGTLLIYANASKANRDGSSG
ncbi:MAG: RDD family protein [Gammaproteobacteria bacterium]|nr:RDD family protein [Gammaproteobacteria bacterium]